MPAARPVSRIGNRPLWRGLFIGIAVTLTLLVIVAPVFLIVVRAFSAGVRAYVDAILTPDTLHAIWLTVLTALIVVPVNTLFGIAAAWAITKFRFPGRKLLVTVIEIPFSISPVIAGAAYLFVYGAQGLFGPLLEAAGIQILFAIPGIVLASMFVTAPFVARELIPLMESQGSDEEIAAVSLGAGGLTTFLRVTLPNIRWALLYGVVLCNARVMGEFGAVSVVSGNIRGQTNTLPLHIELLYHDYNAVGAFAAASVLTLLALVTLAAKTLLERQDGVRAAR
ncbi:MAG TPA: sulfate ABC transporter permease subunit CysW [Bauldia sp.]|nr:sulfate ABC transporter permease subunit CysW [Bauldia sp.]